MEQVELVGGPLDGRTVEVDHGAAEVWMTMADRSRHCYVADAVDPDGVRRFTWFGRR